MSVEDLITYAKKGKMKQMTLKHSSNLTKVKRQKHVDKNVKDLTAQFKT